jgi:hypothetical protein
MLNVLYHSHQTNSKSNKPKICRRGGNSPSTAPLWYECIEEDEDVFIIFCTNGFVVFLIDLWRISEIESSSSLEYFGCSNLVDNTHPKEQQHHYSITWTNICYTIVKLSNFLKLLVHLLLLGSVSFSFASFRSVFLYTNSVQIHSTILQAEQDCRNILQPFDNHFVYVIGLF